MNFECPQCSAPVSQEGQKFCNRCGADLREFYAAQNITVVEAASEGELEDTLTMDVEALKARVWFYSGTPWLKPDLGGGAL